MKLDYILSLGLGGSRFYLTYSGATPTGIVLDAIAADINAAWATDIKPMVAGANALTEVDVLDITTTSGASGFNTTEVIGSRVGLAVPNQVPANTEFQIARRYRGGKPRMFWPAGVVEDWADDAHWNSAFVTNMDAAVLAFFTAVKAITASGTSILNHVNLSLYQGFHNITNTSGRTRAAPTYRTGSAVEDIVNGYSTKAEFGSQRRRRVATTP